ncbi:MAG: FMN-binding protein [Lachnospiraceae bacterium]|jgi:uncharacterized protein with FMN-binding domain|nr:FMN-binding protein [Lachnospiraceae bacterium]
MRMFWVRSADLLVIVAALFIYQSQAHVRTQIISAQEEQQKALRVQEAYKEAMDKIAMDKTEGSQTAENTQEPENVLGAADGIYTGTGTGFSGDLTVEVTVEKGKIRDISITDTQDDDDYLDRASALLGQIMDAQGTDGIDVISGATYSSKGILEAVEHALEGAG